MRSRVASQRCCSPRPAATAYFLRAGREAAFGYVDQPLRTPFLAEDRRYRLSVAAGTALDNPKQQIMRATTTSAGLLTKIRYIFIWFSWNPSTVIQVIGILQ